ncbi:DUF3105 domain-containing protein [Thermomonospora umbrina]|uniref:Uncharacterized protein DUF3105 n=1 Tax=Thermomonospora umbrina TaxID=111806 RepID=A0A3D9SFI1_9ACTN|nr:DUF3105 domain-containing protein [Thermomonospora umbrina]REE94666.1 uncharacterized protein DUF3105 [Thermomonospora umbrina]
MSKSARNRNNRQNPLTQSGPPWGTIAFFTVIGVIVVAAIGFAGWQAFKPAEKIAGLVEKDGLERTHVETPVTYETNPPMGGPHSAIWQNCDGRVYDQPLKNENAVHALEHGAVWITYRPGLSAGDVDKLKNRVEGTDYTLLSPVQGQSSPIALTAWGKQVKVDKADDKRIGEFLKAYVKGPQTPEPGAACSGGKDTP